MKYVLLTTIAAVVFVGCGKKVNVQMDVSINRPFGSLNYYLTCPQ